METTIYVDRMKYQSAINEWTLKIPLTEIDKNDIRNLGIGENFYFRIVNTPVVYGPYLTTSKSFVVYPEDNPDFDETVYCIFFSPTEKPAEEFNIDEEEDSSNNMPHRLSGKPECLTPEKVFQEISVLIIDESDYIFTFTHIRGFFVQRIVKKFSQGWFKELIRLKEKVINCFAKNEAEDVLRHLADFSELIFSFLIAGNEEFYSSFSENVRIIPLNRANLIPFNWIFQNNSLLQDTLRTYSFGFLNIQKVQQTLPEKYDLKNALIICDPTATLVSAPEEGRRLYDDLTKQGIETDIISRELNFVNIKNFFEKYDMIHFIGHGEGGWKIGSQKILTPDKVPVFKKCPFLVVSHSCRTSLNLGETSLSEALLKRGVKWIIASELDIPDKNFFCFFKSFYDNVLSGMKPDRALAESIRFNQSEKKSEWIFFKSFGNR